MAQLSLFDFGASPSQGPRQRPPRQRSGLAPTGGQQALPIGPVNMRQFEPVQNAVQGAQAYTHGGYSPQGLDQVQVNPRRGFAVQGAYRKALSSPTEAPGIRKSYEKMRGEVNNQYDFMTRPQERGGMGLQHQTVDEDPYKTPQDMARDVAAGKIKTLSTKATGPHAVFSNEENDRFRAVHDVFGHAATGRGFSRNGEEAAYLSHRQMFSKKAIPALTSETRGQNSYLNYGPGDFPDQGSKLIGLPGTANRKR